LVSLALASLALVHGNTYLLPWCISVANVSRQHCPTRLLQQRFSESVLPPSVSFPVLVLLISGVCTHRWPHQYWLLADQSWPEEVGARRVVIIEIPLGWLNESDGERSEERMDIFFCFRGLFLTRTSPPCSGHA
jgi:hypothetical protein